MKASPDVDPTLFSSVDVDPTALPPWSDTRRRFTRRGLPLWASLNVCRVFTRHHQTRRRRSTFATTTRCVGTPSRKFRFLARVSWNDPEHVAPICEPEGSRPTPHPKTWSKLEAASGRLDSHAANRMARPTNRARRRRPKITESRISPNEFSERAPAMRASSTFVSKVRAHETLASLIAFRTDRDPLRRILPWRVRLLRMRVREERAP